MGRRRTIWIVAVVLTALVSAACRPPVPFPGHGHHGPHDPGPPAARPVGSAAELDLDRPRVELRAADVPVIQDRLTRTPYSTLLARAAAKIAEAAPPSAVDQAECGLTPNIGREEGKARAAKNLAFMYTVNRTWDPATQTVVVPTPAARQAIGDLARDYLRFSCITSRIHIQPDRDINTANELTQMAQAYDTLAGGGYPFGDSEATIIANLTTWTDEFFRDYQPLLGFLTNNHGAKGAAAIGTAAIALAGAPGTDPDRIDRWLDYGMAKTEEIVRYTMGSADSGYGEGPFYWRYASQNVLPFARAFHHVAGGAGWARADGPVVENFWTAPWFSALGRWELDLTRPDGTLIPIDDGNVDDAFYFGLLPTTDANADGFSWRWANVPNTSASQPFESEGNVDLSTDQIANFDDSVAAAPPTGSPNRLRGASGTLAFRSSWAPDAVAAFVQAEREGARGFGRAPGKPGIGWAALHDHADPGAFQLDAYGERLMLDPGCMNYTWSQHGPLSNPSAHNLVLVGPASDPESPGNPNTASTVGSPALTAFTTDPTAPVPVDGEATVSDVVDRHGIAAATVSSVYGRSPSYVAPSPLRASDYFELESADSTRVQRRYLFVDGRYLVIADSLGSDQPRRFSWPLHGNGGGTDGITEARPKLNGGDRAAESAPAIPATPYAASGGTFTLDPAGGTWTRARARVTTGMAFNTTTAPDVTATLGLYEQFHGRLGANTVLTTSVLGSSVRAASVIYPTPTSAAPPTITRLPVDGVAALRIDDPGADRRILVVTGTGGTSRTYPSSVTGMPFAITTDAAIAIVEVDHAGRVTFRYREGGTHLDRRRP